MKNKVFVGTVPFPKLLLHGGEAAITCGCAVRRWLSGTQTRPTTPEVHMGAGSFLGTVQTSGSTRHPINPPLGSSGSVPPSPSEGKEVITIKPKQYGKGRCLSCCRSRRGKGARGPQSPCVHNPRVEWCLWAGSDCTHGRGKWAVAATCLTGVWASSRLPGVGERDHLLNLPGFDSEHSGCEGAGICFSKI